MAQKLEQIVNKEGVEESAKESTPTGFLNYLKKYTRESSERLNSYVKSSKDYLATNIANFATGGQYSSLKRENEELKKQVATDSLTGLYNKRKLKSDLEEQINLYNRHNDEFSLIMMDIDHFKTINDTYGHETGDDILAKVGEMFKAYTRAEDKVYRYGGEEFCVIMPKTGKEEAIKAGERLREVLSSYSENGLPKFTMSAGVSNYSAGETACDTIKRADNALYEAKNNGRNRLYSS